MQTFTHFGSYLNTICRRAKEIPIVYMLSRLFYRITTQCFRLHVSGQTISDGPLHEGQILHRVRPDRWIWSWSNTPLEEGNHGALSGSPQGTCHQVADSGLSLSPKNAWVSRNGGCCTTDAFGRLKELYEGGHLSEAVDAAELMGQQGPYLPTNLLYCLLQGCIQRKNMILGRRVHALIVSSGLQQNAFLGSHLIRMYSALGSLSEAQKVFSELLSPDTFVWAAIISAYSKHGQSDEAIKVYHQLHERAVKPNDYIFVAVLKACSCAGSLAAGKLIHSHVVEYGLEFNVHVGNTLLDMYAKCGSLGDARNVFNKLPTKDLVTWTALIVGYTLHGYGEEALQLFWQMKCEGMHLDKVNLLSILKACSTMLALEHARLIHSFIKEINLEFDLFVASSLINLYVKCGNVEEAQTIFDRLPQRDHVTWTAMIAGYAQNGDCHQALLLYQQMLQESLEPDRVTCISILKACSVLEALEQGRLIHVHVLTSGGESDIYLANTLIDMYAKSGSLEDARRLFERLPTRDLVSLNALLAGYAEHGDAEVALALCLKMQQEGMQPDNVTLMNILKACSCIGSIDQGKAVHTYIMDQGFKEDTLIASSLIDMYGKCGSPEDARGVFDSLHRKDLVCYSTIIAAYAQHGYGQMALEVFHQMQNDDICPNSVTFVCLLSACSNCGLLEEGLHLFNLMADFGLTPNMEHYVCMVDLLGRTGHVYKAAALITSMPFVQDIRVWRSLLASCRIHGDVDLGRHAYEGILKLDVSHTAAYLLMAEVYSAAGRSEDEEQVLQKMHTAGLKKQVGRTWMQLNDQLHSFVAQDMEHPDEKQFYTHLRNVRANLLQ